MPFDGIYDGRQGYLLQKLDAVAALLASENQWCKGRWRDSSGSRCLVGALIDADAKLALYQPLLRAVTGVTRTRYCRLESFNDAPDTNFRIVQAVLDQARIDIISGNAPRGVIYALSYRIARARDDGRFTGAFYSWMCRWA